MKQNIGPIDRAIRGTVGLAALAAAYATGNLWFLLGLAPLLTAVLGFCPAYCPLGINTCCKGDDGKPGGGCCGGGSCR